MVLASYLPLLDICLSVLPSPVKKSCHIVSLDNQQMNCFVDRYNIVYGRLIALVKGDLGCMISSVDFPLIFVLHCFGKDG